MAKGKKHTPEQIVSLLRQIEVAVANGKTTPVACRENEITEQTYYRWWKEYGGLQVDQAWWLKELDQENAKLKRLGSELNDLTNHIKDLQGKSNRAQTELEGARRDLTKATTERDSLTAELDRLHNNLKTVEENRDAAKYGLESAQAALQNLIPGVLLPSTQ